MNDLQNRKVLQLCSCQNSSPTVCHDIVEHLINIVWICGIPINRQYVELLLRQSLKKKTIHSPLIERFSSPPGVSDSSLSIPMHSDTSGVTKLNSALSHLTRTDHSPPEWTAHQELRDLSGAAQSIVRTLLNQCAVYCNQLSEVDNEKGASRLVALSFAYNSVTGIVDLVEVAGGCSLGSTPIEVVALQQTSSSTRPSSASQRQWRKTMLEVSMQVLKGAEDLTEETPGLYGSLHDAQALCSTSNTAAPLTSRGLITSAVLSSFFSPVDVEKEAGAEEAPAEDIVAGEVVNVDEDDIEVLLS